VVTRQDSNLRPPASKGGSESPTEPAVTLLPPNRFRDAWRAGGAAAFGGAPSTIAGCGGAGFLPELHKFANVTLERGIISSLELVPWHREILQGQMANARRTVVIVVADESGADQARWVVREAWPAKLEVGALNARGNEVLIETLELATEGVERVA